MATIYYLKSGLSQQGNPDNRPLDWCICELGLAKKQRIKNVKRPLIIGQPEDPAKAPRGGHRYAVVKITPEDITAQFSDWQTGEYLLGRSATEVKDILKRST